MIRSRSSQRMIHTMWSTRCKKSLPISKPSTRTCSVWILAQLCPFRSTSRTCGPLMIKQTLVASSMVFLACSWPHVPILSSGTRGAAHCAATSLRGCRRNSRVRVTSLGACLAIHQPRTCWFVIVRRTLSRRFSISGLTRQWCTS